jgi:predicted transcriptional regulator of viral defense system
MKFEDLLSLIRNQPVFETGLLLTGDVDPNDVRRQLSRWERSGRIRQLRRGLYTLAPPYQNIIPDPFLIANALVTGSYVSSQSALAFYGLIPEYVPRTISVTIQRPAQWDGGFHFHHIASHLFFGYQLLEVSLGQQAFIATPEKALLDLAHLTPTSDSSNYLMGLRLQNLVRLDMNRLYEFASRAGKPKWKRIAQKIQSLVEQEKVEYEELT